MNNPLIYVDPSGELSVRQILLLAKSFAESFVKKAAQKIVEAIGGLSLKNLGFFKDIVVGIIKGVIRLSDIASVLAEGYFKEYIEPVERLINLSSEVFGRGVVCDSKVIEYGKYLGIAVCNIVEIISDFATGGTGVFGKVAGKLVSVLGKAGKRVRVKLGKIVKKYDVLWDLPPYGGKYINGRYYTQHALERMAPDIPEVRDFLVQKYHKIATEECGYKPGTKDYIGFMKDKVNPRGIPPMVVENAIRHGKRQPGKNPGTWDYITSDVKVVVNERGDVVTVHKIRGK